MAERNNLIYNPSFRIGTDGLDGWTGINQAVITPNYEYVFYGQRSAQVTKDRVNSSGITSTYLPSVTPNLPYAVLAHVYVPSIYPKVEDAILVVRIEWLDAKSVEVTESMTQQVTVTDQSGWVRLSGVFTAPTGATNARISVLQPLAGSVGAYFILDSVLFEQSEYVGGYIETIPRAREVAYVQQALSRYQQKATANVPLKADVTLNDLILNTIDEDGVVWICTDIDGWWGQSNPDSPDIERGIEDGSYDVTGRYQARSLTLSGSFLPQTPDDVPRARDKLIEATNLVRKGAWLRTNEEPTKAAFVRLSGRPKIVTVNARGRTDFEIPLKSGDPIKYLWNDLDPDGLTRVRLQASDVSVSVENIGTSDVTATFRMYGPMAEGSNVTNAATGEVITLVRPLRRAGNLGDVVKSQLYDGVATLTTSNDNQIFEGDQIIVTDVGSPYDSISGKPFTVISSTTEEPYEVSYKVTSTATLDEVDADGTIRLYQDDVLEVDTYNKSVTFNGNGEGERSRLETLSRWIKLIPGRNDITVSTKIAHMQVSHKQYANGVVTLTTRTPHQLRANDTVQVTLPTSAQIAGKAVNGTTGDVTITTDMPHGFSVNDKITVESTSVSGITGKNFVVGSPNSTATLNTDVSADFGTGDTIIVALPVDRVLLNKVVDGTTSPPTVTFTTQGDHGYSSGDKVTVALTTDATVQTKILKSNVATLTTTAPHGFSPNDTITVSLPGNAAITNKYVDGNTVVITTSVPHLFSTGDLVSINLPTVVTPVGTRSFGGSANYKVTLNTATAHGYMAGDQITVDLKIPTTVTVSNRSATTTASTLTTSTTHNFAVGERITVTGVDTDYDGTYTITAVTSNTLTYATNGPAEASVSSSGTVVNTTLAYGYNGTKVIDSVGTTSLSYYYYGSDVATSSTVFGTSPTVTNLTNIDINGTVPRQISVGAAANTFTYNKTA